MTKKNNSLSAQIELLSNGSLTSSQLIKQALDNTRLYKDLNAFVALNPNQVIAQAELSDKRRQQGRTLSPIDGVPIAVKDNYLTKDYPTTACSNALPLEPTDLDATVVVNLRAAGAIIFAKTNMHEWAYGATNSTSSFGAPKNPHNHDCITGGSSGGSAAAVAAGIVGAALGSDTGGSVRIPSSACGTYGFKPSFGRASCYGVLPLSWSLDAPGPITASLDDIEVLLPYFLGADKNDPNTYGSKPFSSVLESSSPKFLNLIGQGLERSIEVGDAIDGVLNSFIGQVKNFELKNVGSYFGAWEAILHCEASSYHSDLLKKNNEGYSSVTRAHLEAGMILTGVELLKAQRIRAQLLKYILNDLPDWDCLILPTLPVVAPNCGDDWQEFGGRRVTTQDSMTWFCWLGNLAGLPCITLPIARSQSGLPIGMMLMGKPAQDEALLACAKWVENQIK